MKNFKNEKGINKRDDIGFMQVINTYDPLSKWKNQTY